MGKCLKCIHWKPCFSGKEWDAAVGDPCEYFATIEAEPVRHGRWVYHECVSSHDGAISGYSCSKCNAFVDEEIFDMDEFHKDFCGHCGAKMDGDSHG